MSVFEVARGWVIVGLLAPALCGAAEGEAKQPIPKAEAQKESLRLVTDVYKDRTAAAKTRAQKLELANALIIDGVATTDDATAQFVMFQLARDMAVQQADLATAWSALEKMAAGFEIDSLPMKAAVLKDVLAPQKTAEAREQYLLYASRIARQATELDRYDVAVNIITSACEKLGSARDTKRSKTFYGWKVLLEDTRREFETLAASQKTLQENPTDASANLAVGRWHWLRKNDWNKGVSHLALGAEKSLRELAGQELKPPEKVEEQIRLADAWWTAAETQEDPMRTAMQERARYWYRKALPLVNGITKAKVTQRLTQKYVWTFEGVEQFDEFFYKAAAPAESNPGGLAMTNAMLIAPKQFTSIQSASIELGIFPGGRGGACIAVGPVTMILNWEEKNENHFRYCFDDGYRPSHVTSPHVLVPGRIHTLNVAEKDGNITVLIDGKEHYSIKGSLAGTVTVVGRAKPVKLLVKQITVVGDADPAVKVTGPVPKNLF